MMHSNFYAPVIYEMIILILSHVYPVSYASLQSLSV